MWYVIYERIQCIYVYDVYTYTERSAPNGVPARVPILLPFSIYIRYYSSCWCVRMCVYYILYTLLFVIDLAVCMCVNIGAREESATHIQAILTTVRCMFQIRPFRAPNVHKYTFHNIQLYVTDKSYIS